MTFTNWRTCKIAALVAAAAITAVPVTAGDFDHTHALFDGVVKAHVANGLVDYAALIKDARPLKQYLAALAQVPEDHFKEWSEPQQIAFLANLYNAATLRLILDHYPVKSIKNIGNWRKGPWDQPVVRLFGETITLNSLEHDILRKQYNEPRLHMALVCAARGCPPLRGEAYTAESLDAQLDDQSRTYLATPAGLVIDRKKGIASLSPIFKWYGGDFPSVSAFIEKQTGITMNGLTLRYLNYDWSLNESTH
jgi:hypothetical protein